MSESLQIALVGLAGTLLGVFCSFVGYFISSHSQRRSDRINHLSHALSDYLSAFSVYQGNPNDANFFTLVSTVERVRLFCSESLLPSVDAFRSKVLDRSTPPSELGRAYRAIADLARWEVNQCKHPRQQHRNRHDRRD